MAHFAFHTVCSVVLLTLLHSVSSQGSPSCCDSWGKEGWRQLTDKPTDPVAECADGLTRAKLTSGQKMMVRWTAGNKIGSLGFSFCKDKEQTLCYVMDMYSLENKTLSYWWRRHSKDEKGGLGWVPGRERLPETKVTFGNMDTTPSWPEDGTLEQRIVVERLPGKLKVRLEGGDTKANEDMTFDLEDEFSFFAVASFFPAGTAEVDGAADEKNGAPRCSSAVRRWLKRGQQLLLDYEPKGKYGSVGISFCKDLAQSDCYVLDMFGEKDNKVGYWWRHHTANESGGEGWVPGRAKKLQETKLQQEPTVGQGWREDGTGKYTFLVTLTGEGRVEVRMEGGDPEQHRQMSFALPNGFYNIAVGTHLRFGKFSVKGPCFNGVRFGWVGSTCNVPVSEEDALKQPNGDLVPTWTLSASTGRGRMVSPSLGGAGSGGRLCFSVVGLALGDARLTFLVERASGEGPKHSVGELLPISNQPQANGGKATVWQRLRFVTALPAGLRGVPLRVVIEAETKNDGLVLLQQVELCNPQDCGVASANGEPFIIYGSQANSGEFPWHAGIYMRDAGVYKAVCGGTIVRPDLVISAAHCFYDELSESLFDKDLYQVTAGKYTRDWNTRDPFEQRSRVIDVLLPKRYRGRKGSYEGDIALVTVKFTVSAIVVPICVDWSGQVTPELGSGDVGVVAGWGLTENRTQSNRLLFAKMPYVRFDECLKSVPETFSPFVTADKFCAGNINGSTVKQGDSGGGLAFKSGGLWFLHGVVSTGVPNTLTYSTFTNVRYRPTLEWMNEQLLRDFVAPQSRSHSNINIECTVYVHIIATSLPVPKNHTENREMGRICS